MQAALDYVRSAGDVVEAAKAGDKYPDKSFSDKSFSEFVEYHPKLLEYSEEALVEAKQTNRQEMNNWYPGLGDHFKNELEEGLKLSASGITTKEKWTFIRGLGLQIRFGDWYNTHHNAIWGTKNTSPPPQLEDDPPAAAPKARPPGQTMGTDSLPSPGCVLGLPCSCGGGPNTPWVCRPDYTAATKSAITTPPPKPARHGRGPVRLNQPPRSCWDPYYRRYYAC